MSPQANPASSPPPASPPATTGPATTGLPCPCTGCYGLLATQAVLGFVLRWSRDQAMSFFGLLIPPPFAPFSKAAQHLIGGVHNWIGWTIIVRETSRTGQVQRQPGTERPRLGARW